MQPRTLSDSIVIERPPTDVYELVADIPRMGEYSPQCKACWWDEGDGPRVGARFTGRNETPDRTWETRCEVVEAEPGRAFAFVVGSTGVRWGYEFVAVDAGTEVTETWTFAGRAYDFYRERFGDDAAAQLDHREATARDGIAQTLAAIKRTAEDTPA